MADADGTVQEAEIEVGQGKVMISGRGPGEQEGAGSLVVHVDDVVAAATALPGVEESTWYRTPALKVAGKGFARLRTEAEGGLVLFCTLHEKAALLASGNPAFCTTPHYDGLPRDSDRPRPHRR